MNGPDDLPLLKKLKPLRPLNRLTAMPDIPNPFGMTPQDETAALLHEMFSSYVKAGFTVDEALRLLAYMAAASPPPDTPGSTPPSG